MDRALLTAPSAIGVGAGALSRLFAVNAAAGTALIDGDVAPAAQLLPSADVKSAREAAVFLLLAAERHGVGYSAKQLKAAFESHTDLSAAAVDGISGAAVVRP